MLDQGVAIVGPFPAVSSYVVQVNGRTTHGRCDMDLIVRFDRRLQLRIFPVQSGGDTIGQGVSKGGCPVQSERQDHEPSELPAP